MALAQRNTRLKPNHATTLDIRPTSTHLQARSCGPSVSYPA